MTVYKSIQGAAKPSSTGRSNIANIAVAEWETHHPLYGQKLVSLHKGQGFGELALARSGGRATRTATVIANGDQELGLLALLHEESHRPHAQDHDALHHHDQRSVDTKLSAPVGIDSVRAPFAWVRLGRLPGAPGVSPQRTESVRFRP